MSESAETRPRKTSGSLRSSRTLGFLAVALWGLALILSVARATLAYDHIKTLLFTGGLIMIDSALAVLVTLMWFMIKHYIRPNIEIRAMDDYKYRAGYRDATIRFLRSSPDLHLVQPAEPTIPVQQPRNNGSRPEAGNHVS